MCSQLHSALQSNIRELLSKLPFYFACAATSWLGTRGRAVQVDPIKPTLKAPGSKLLKPEHDKLLSNFVFNFNLRRYTGVGKLGGGAGASQVSAPA